jgi:hypothetical protein
MKIQFTKKEYRLLLDMICIADWVMNCHHVGPVESNTDHTLLYQKLLSFSKSMQADDVIEYAKDTNEYYQTNEHEETLHDKYIEPYDNETFWDELIDRLSGRDFVKEFGIERIREMSRDERMILRMRIEEKYGLEFEKHGLENISINFETVSSGHTLSVEEVENNANECTTAFEKLEHIKQKIFKCRKTLVTITVLREHFSSLKGDWARELNHLFIGSLINSLVITLKTIHEPDNKKDRDGNFFQLLKLMLKEGCKVSEIKSNYKKYFHNDLKLRKIKNYRDDTAAHDLIEKTKDLSLDELSSVLDETIDLIKSLDVYFNINEDDYVLLYDQHERDAINYIKVLKSGLKHRANDMEENRFEFDRDLRD